MLAPTIGTISEITEFLNTFFKLYPTASEKERTYYTISPDLQQIGIDYVSMELLTPVYTKSDNGNTHINESVKHLDQLTKAAQLSQFDLTLTKDTNWKIIQKKLGDRPYMDSSFFFCITGFH